MRPRAASSRMRPVGVGRMSRGPMESCGTDDDGGQTLAEDHVLDSALGHGLAALVGADRLVGRKRRRLVDRRRGARHAQGGNTARIDDAFNAGGQRLALEVQRSLDVGADDLRGITRPQAIVRGDMKQVAHALQRRLQRFAIGEVANHDLAVEATEIIARTGSAYERTHAHAALDQGAHDGRPQKARSAGDEGQIARPQGCIHLSIPSAPRSRLKYDDIRRFRNSPADACFSALGSARVRRQRAQTAPATGCGSAGAAAGRSRPVAGRSPAGRLAGGRGTRS